MTYRIKNYSDITIDTLVATRIELADAREKLASFAQWCPFEMFTDDREEQARAAQWKLDKLRARELVARIERASAWQEEYLGLSTTEANEVVRDILRG